jgi:branched-chain amino acid transport system ATP-binding protein
MSEPLLLVNEATKRFGGLLAVDHASLSCERGSITGLIGPNGAGKTTLFAMVSGFVRPSSGAIRFDGHAIDRLPPHERAMRGIARTFQIVQPFAGLSVRDNIAVGAHLRAPRRAAALEKAEAVGRLVGLGDLLDGPASALTVSGRKRLELARALATEPKLLLLDEVLAGLNPSEVRDVIPVIRAIRDSGVTILMVEHVMQAVMSLCEDIYVLAQGRMIAHGSPDVVTRDPQVIEAYLGHGAANRLAAREGTGS